MIVVFPESNNSVFSTWLLILFLQCIYEYGNREGEGERYITENVIFRKSEEWKWKSEGAA